MNKQRLESVFFFALAIFVFCLTIAAQPGDEARWYERTAATLKTLDEKIAGQANDAQLHFQRGSLYLNLFRVHPEVAEYRGVTYAVDPGGKALADLNKAIELDRSRSEYYLGRAKFYDYKWRHTVSRESEAAASSWEKIRLLLWDNRSFDSAVKDYQKAGSIARTGSEMLAPLDGLGWLYRTRASSASFYATGKTVRAEKQTRLVFDDFDRSLEFTRKYLDAQNNGLGEFIIRDIYFDKARAAIEFEEYAAGIGFLSEGIKEIDDRPGLKEGLCSLYVLRGDIRQRLKDYEGAIGDFTYPIDQKYVNCDSIREKRGDAYAARGEWQRAIADYSSELKKYSYIPVSLLTRRARAYIKTGNAEKAVADLSEAMTFHKFCPEQFQLRAEAFRILKDEARAAEDEKKAADLSRNKIGCSL